VKAVDKLKSIVDSCDAFLENIHQLGIAPTGEKVLRRLWSPGDAANLVGRDRSTIGRIEQQLDLAPNRNPDTNRRLGYSLPQIQALRTHFGTTPWRKPGVDPALIVACQNFKGGVGKSTTCVNFGQYLGLAGYRVLIVDADSQATTTSYFGLVPDIDIHEEQTILPYLLRLETSLRGVIRKTHWPTVDLIPSCIALYDSEIEIIKSLSDEPNPAKRLQFFSELQYGLREVSENYDFILVDAPPALGMISLNVLVAADALIVPCAPKMNDFASTAKFFTMVHKYLSVIDPTKEIRLLGVLTTLFDARFKLQKDFVKVIRDCFGDCAFQRVMYHSREIVNGSAEWMTPYEMPDPNYKVLEMMNSVFEEIEYALLREWPSKNELLEARGVA
jgi:chromosome partitioning protein